MLKRKDLVKEFELVVTQEIVNNQRDRNVLNDKLNQLQLDHDKLKEVLRSKIAEFDSKIRSIQSNFEGLTDQVFAAIEDIKKLINKMTRFTKEYAKQLSGEIEKNDQKFEQKGKLDAFATHVELQIESLSKDLYYAKDFIKRELDKSNKQQNKQLESMRDELLSTPEEIDLLAEKLRKEMEVSKVNKDGLLKELNLCKKSIFYLEKKVENLYTINRRLKETIKSLNASPEELSHNPPQST